MRKNLSVIGNSLGIIIDKPILDLLGITKETTLEVLTDGKRLIIEPASTTAHTERVMRASESVLKSHERTFKKLAE